MKHILLFLIVLFCSCSRQGSIEDIKTLVFSKENDLDVNDGVSYKFIPLESTDDCLISGVRYMEIVDDKIYINSGNDKLLVFSMTGKFIDQIGKKGSGPGEYKSMCNFHIDKEKQLITVTDNGQSRIITYRLDNYEHINTKKIFYFSDCVWLSDGNIAWYFGRGYESDKKELYSIKITDQDLKPLTYLLPFELELNYPVTIGPEFYSQGEKSYLNLSYIPTIYELNSQKITPVYQLDLGEHKFAPAEWLQKEGRENYSVIVYTDYISAQAVLETDNYFSVGYCAKGANLYIGFYNKQTGQSCKFSSPDFIRYTGMTGVGVMLTTYDDYFVTVLNSAVLKRNPNTKIAELKSISENINEEDNPVVCLMKLK